MVQSQNFDVSTSHTVNGDVVLVQNQFTGAWDTTCSAHAGVNLESVHCVFQFQHKTDGAARVVFGNEGGDLVDSAKRRFGPFQRHRSGAVFGEDGLDLIVGREFASIGFLDAVMNITDLPGLSLHVAGQRIDGQEALGPRRRLGQFFDLVVESLGQAHVDGFGSHACNASLHMYYIVLSALRDQRQDICSGLYGELSTIKSLSIAVGTMSTA